MKLFYDGREWFETANVLHFCKEKTIEVVADSRNGKDTMRVHALKGTVAN